MESEHQSMLNQLYGQTSIRGPPPSLLALLVTVFVTGIVILAYAVIGCDPDWVIIGGLMLDILGAIGLVVLDIPALASHTYVEDLRKLQQDLSNTEPPTIRPDSDTHRILLSSVGEYVDLQEPVEFSINGNSLQIKNDHDENISLLIVQQRLRRQIARESGRLRRGGLYLLSIGFGLQAAGIISNSLIGLRAISHILNKAGIHYPIC